MTEYNEALDSTDSHPNPVSQEMMNYIALQIEDNEKNFHFLKYFASFNLIVQKSNFCLLLIIVGFYYLEIHQVSTRLILSPYIYLVSEFVLCISRTNLCFSLPFKMHDKSIKLY